MADSNAKKLAQLLDANGDVLITNLDNVNTNLVADTTPQLGGDLDLNSNNITGTGTVDLSSNTDALSLPSGTTAQRPSPAVTGMTRFNTDLGTMEQYTGVQWLTMSQEVPQLDSISGTIYVGASSTLTGSGSGFGTAPGTVNFTQVSDGIDVDVSVTPTNDAEFSVTVPSSVYNNVTAGNSVTIKFTNSDSIESGTQTALVFALPSGGTVTTSGNYRIHTFTSSDTFTVNSSISNVEYLVVAGGGGAGGYHGQNVGGNGAGGAGGYRSSVPSESSGGGASAESRISSMPSGSYTITVGAGGSGVTSHVNGNAGGDSSISGSGITTITSTGGGYGGRTLNAPGGSGGSGGSSGEFGPSGGSGTSGQGYPGGNSGNQATGGGGGAAGAGGNSGNSTNGASGGNGVASSITGSSVTRAGGGGGAGDDNGSGGPGGSGGGGNGSRGGPASDGSTNTGGGGGAHGRASVSRSAQGGSGIVIVRYEV